MPLGQVSRTELFLHIYAGADGRERGRAPARCERPSSSVDATLPVLSVETRASNRDHNLLFALLRVGAAVFMVFGGIALGLVDWLASTASKPTSCNRTREIGIRIALGATPRCRLDRRARGIHAVDGRLAPGCSRFRLSRQA